MQNRFIKIAVLIISISMLLLSGCQVKNNVNIGENPDQNLDALNDTDKTEKSSKNTAPFYDVNLAIENSKTYESFRQQMDMNMSMVFDEDMQENFLTKILQTMAEMSVSTDISLENYNEDNLAELSMSGLINVKFAGVEQSYEIYMKDGLAYTFDDDRQLIYEKIKEEKIEDTTTYAGIKQYLLSNLSVEDAVTSEMIYLI
jgi:hypothetical protein